MKIKDELILFKESGLINCEDKFSIIQRKGLNALLFIAKRFIYNNPENYDFTGKSLNLDIDNNKIFISYQEIKELISDKIVDTTNLNFLLDELTKISFKANIDAKDKYNIWQTNFSFLQGFTPLNNGLEFELSNALFKIITTNPTSSLKSKTPFAKIDIQKSKTFKSKYTLILYEFISDYFNAKTIPFLAINELRLRFGIAPHEYKRFYNLRKKCIDPAIKEINNSNIPFTLQYVIKKSGNIIGVLFSANQRLIVEVNFTKDLNADNSNSLPENQEPQTIDGDILPAEPKPEDQKLPLVSLDSQIPKTGIPEIFDEYMQE